MESFFPRRGRVFQSTRPARGATYRIGPMCRQERVSIHAPRAGRDFCASPNRISSPWFQSTRPARGATPQPGLLLAALRVSIHAPRAGRDVRIDRLQGREDVSIHAPRAGRDFNQIMYFDLIQSFNPRAPRGARLARFEQRRRQCMFQSTRPARGATSDHRSGGYAFEVSIHAPRAGRDRRRPAESSSSASFNPRAPRGARPALDVLDAAAPLVSIHAPRAGRDGVLRKDDQRARVSIHAPRAGRDKR